MRHEFEPTCSCIACRSVRLTRAAEHVESDKCWCGPVVETLADGSLLYIHNAAIAA